MKRIKLEVRVHPENPLSTHKSVEIEGKVIFVDTDIITQQFGDSKPKPLDFTYDKYRPFKKENQDINTVIETTEENYYPDGEAFTAYRKYYCKLSHFQRTKLDIWFGKSWISKAGSIQWGIDIVLALFGIWLTCINYNSNNEIKELKLELDRTKGKMEVYNTTNLNTFSSMSNRVTEIKTGLGKMKDSIAVLQLAIPLKKKK